MASDASQSALPAAPHIIDPGDPRHYAQDQHIPPLKCRRRNGPDRFATATQIKNFMWTYPTAEVTARYFDVSIASLYRYIKKWWNLSFDEFRDRNMSHTRHLLTQKAIEMALKQGNSTALALCMKNLCGWSESAAVAPSAMPVVTLRYSLDTPPSSPPPRDVTEESA